MHISFELKIQICFRHIIWSVFGWKC